MYFFNFCMHTYMLTYDCSRCFMPHPLNNHSVISLKSNRCICQIFQNSYSKTLKFLWHEIIIEVFLTCTFEVKVTLYFQCNCSSLVFAVESQHPSYCMFYTLGNVLLSKLNLLYFCCEYWQVKCTGCKCLTLQFEIEMIIYAERSLYVSHTAS